jgi:hypothetical protein
MAVINKVGLSEWIKEFAEKSLNKEAEGTNPFQEIKSLFGKNKELMAIEEKLQDFRHRIGLNRLAKEEIDIDNTKTASYDEVAYMISLANRLDEVGLIKEANDIDNMLRYKLATLEIFEKFPKLQIFIDNLIRSRGGHVSVPAVLKMVRDERPEESDVASDSNLKKYIEDKIKEDKKIIEDSGDNIAGIGVGVATTFEDQYDSDRMFEPSKK